MKFTIKKNKQIYFEDSNGFWAKSEYNKKGICKRTLKIVTRLEYKTKYMTKETIKLTTKMAMAFGLKSMTKEIATIMKTAEYWSKSEFDEVNQQFTLKTVKEMSLTSEARVNNQEKLGIY